MKSLFRSFLRRFAGNEKGNILILFALMLPVLAGMVGLGMDVGGWYADKRKLQNSADAGAVAGAQEIKLGGSSVTSVATSAAEQNGYDDAVGDIDVNNPPESGSYTADNNAVEVNLSSPANIYLAKVLLGAFSFDIAARAVATQGEAGEACILALDTSGAAVTVTGNGDINVDGCQVASNSEDDDALTVSGSGDLITDCYSVSGGIDVTSGLQTDVGCDGQTGASPIDDPYASLVAPDAACDSAGITHNDTSTLTLSGSFDDPYVICGDLWAKKGTVELEPGLYIIDGGDLKSNAQGNITGEGVTIILKNNAQINNFNGSSTVQLSAPTDDTDAGDWQGILFYQDRDTTDECTGNNCNTLNGNGSTEFEGVVYFPNQEINVNGGNSGASKCLQVVALRVAFSGSSDLYSDNSECPGAGVDPIIIPGPVQLVE